MTQFSVDIDIALTVVWVVQVYLIGVWRIGIDLILV